MDKKYFDNGYIMILNVLYNFYKKYQLNVTLNIYIVI